MKTTALTLFFVIFLQSFSYSQNYYGNFKALDSQNDTSKAIALLKEWEKNKPDDPDLYVAGFNYYISLAVKELNKDNEENTQNKNHSKEDSAKLALLRHTERIKRIDNNMNKSSEYINNGIQKFPDRLDMRFGKCYILIESKQYKELTEEVVRTVERSALNKNKWFWMNNVPKEDGEGFLLDNIQGYIRALYDTGDDSLLTNILTIGKVTLKYYPNSIPILSSTAVILSQRNEYAEAITLLLKAESINGNDIIVLLNIGECYSRKGDKENAKKYYMRVMELGSDREKEEARKRLNALGK